jgi:hypothetical protein
MLQGLLIRRAARLRREVVDRERSLYGRHFDDAIFLRKRGFGVHVEATPHGRRFRLGNRLICGTELKVVVARERRLLKQARKDTRKGN